MLLDECDIVLQIRIFLGCKALLSEVSVNAAMSFFQLIRTECFADLLMVAQF